MSSNHALDKTFVERSPTALIPSAFTSDGSDNVLLPNSRPVAGQTCIGSSLITDIIGEGGMATVYKVWNERLEMVRVIKLLLHDTFHARFETEAKITAKLHHDGIVAVYHADEWNGLPYMEMEFVDGFNLKQALAERGKLPEIVCIAIAVLVADALTHAHTQTFMLAGKSYRGIIHRDLKPANIMIAKYGATKLIDFGVACPTQTNLHTAEGHIDGTLHYISPEQMEGGETDNRSDIYSFGTILYEMLTGAKTFPQESIAELLKQKTAHKFKSPHDYGTPVSVDLANIIHRCLKSAPTKRYQNTQELTESLKKLYESLTTQTPEDVLKNYFSGNENLIHTISSKTKTRRFIDKLKTLWPWGKSKTPKPLDKPKLLGISDKPKTEDANSNEIKTLWFLDKLKTLWALGRSKTPKPSNKPKISDKPKTPELLEKPKNETGHTRNTIAVGKNTTPLKSSHKKQRVNTSDGKNKRKKK